LDRSTRYLNQIAHFLLVKNAIDIGALDIHCRLDGAATATLTILQETTNTNFEFSALLTKIDEELILEIRVV
jgi:hypothetical protein